MYTVLMAVDEDESRAAAQAEAVADLPDHDDVSVVVFHDFTDNPTGASAPQVGSVRRASEILEADGFDVTVEEASGEPSQTILETAADVDANVICLAGRKRTPTGKVLFGSVTQAVVLNADRPVLVVPLDA